MPLSDDPEKREKQLANLKPQYGRAILEEIGRSNRAETTKRIIELAPICYPNVTKLAKEAHISRAYLRYLIDTDEDLRTALNEYVLSKLDGIEENVLNAAQKEQYASLGMGVLNRLHPRWKEEKQPINTNIQINFGKSGVNNPYDDVDDAQVTDSDTSSDRGGEEPAT